MRPPLLRRLGLAFRVEWFLRGIPVVLIAVAAGCGPSKKHLHHVPKAEYALPCVIENVEVVVMPNLEATHAECNKYAPAMADDGKPLAANERSGGCFYPTVRMYVDKPMQISGRLIVRQDKDSVYSEFEHLIWNACRK